MLGALPAGSFHSQNISAVRYTCEVSQCLSIRSRVSEGDNLQDLKWHRRQMSRHSRRLYLGCSVFQSPEMSICNLSICASRSRIPKVSAMDLNFESASFSHYLSVLDLMARRRARPTWRFNLNFLVAWFSFHSLVEQPAILALSVSTHPSSPLLRPF